MYLKELTDTDFDEQKLIRAYLYMRGEAFFFFFSPLIENSLELSL